jgi:hypothetical protein
MRSLRNGKKVTSGSDPVPSLRIYISENSRGHACGECIKLSQAEEKLRSDRASAAVQRTIAKLFPEQQSTDCVVPTEA